tara:strand:- start:273 stop:530 length:258 start_codon:yes stop_codon:yes gene_type:complete
MLTHTRVKKPTSGTEFGNMNGFINTEATAGTLTWTLWNPDEGDSTVRTFEYAAGKCPVNVFVPLAVKKVVAGTAADLNDVTVYGV